MKILVTGGCGFIGSNFIHSLLKSTNFEVINLDDLTYAGNKENLKDIENNERYSFIKGNLINLEDYSEDIKNVEYVVHFAAESHVDRSIKDPAPFITTNILGTQILLKICKELEVRKYVHISTDEVYGTINNNKDTFRENDNLKPNSPYSASKASGDLLVRSYFKTFNLPAVVVRPSNNYGYYQFPEKLMPLAITNLIEDLPIPIYGKGENIREWLFVEDCCEGILHILKNGVVGEIYNLGSGVEKRTIDIAEFILKEMGKNPEEYINYVKDRPGHDYRYALDSSKIRSLGWRPKISFEEGMMKTIAWYKENVDWWKPLKKRVEEQNKGFWN
jgi:dTDP-glucose 4,6-dehydratase